MPDRFSLTATTAPDSLRDLSPSAKLVAKTLEYEGRLTQSELSEETRLPARTVRFALTQLQDHGVVKSRISLRDARQQLYSLAVGEETRDGEADVALDRA